MKRIITITAIILSFTAVQAQDAVNTVKWNLEALLYRNLSFQYERTMTDNIGLNVQFGYLLPKAVPKTFTDTSISGSSGQNFMVTGAKFKGGPQITPEFRYYFKGEGNQGFYLGAYVRWAKYSMDMDANYRKDDVSPYKPYHWTGSLNLLHIGGIMGTQFHIGDHFTIDWWIAGLQFGSSKVKMNATGDFSGLSQQEFQDDISANLNSPFIHNIEATLKPTEANLSFKPIGIGFRTGLCLGFRF
jgi:hypothetical protein